MATVGSAFQWDVSYATGITEIDAQHRNLFALTNKVIQLSEGNVTRPVLAMLLGQLEDYARDHFDHEESIMEWAGYGGLDEHRKQHAQLREELELLSTQLGQGALAATELAVFVQNWLAKHILHEDMRYLPAIQEKRGV